MAVSFSRYAASSKASSSVTVLQLVILMSVYLPERRLNFQLNRPGPAVVNAYVIHFSLKIRKTIKIILK